MLKVALCFLCKNERKSVIFSYIPNLLFDIKGTGTFSMEGTLIIFFCALFLNMSQQLKNMFCLERILAYKRNHTSEKITQYSDPL